MAGTGIFVFATTAEVSLGSTYPSPRKYQLLFPWGKVAGALRLTILVHLVLRSQMHAVTPSHHPFTFIAFFK